MGRTEKEPPTRGGTRPDPRVRVVPLIPQRWREFQKLFATSATTRGCQCMWFFQTSAEFRQGYGAGNRRRFRTLVDAERAPGLLAYVGGEVAGWCALGPKEAYSRYARSRLFRGPSDPGTWAIVCFYVPNERRGGGLMGRLIADGVQFARDHGARAVEGYPVVSGPTGRTDPSSGYHGFLGPFRRNGFRVVARPSEGRAIVRRELAERSTSSRPGPREPAARRGGPPKAAASPASSRGRRSASG